MRDRTTASFEAAAVFTERETKTAASRTCVVLIDASIDRETVWRGILRKEVIQPQVPLRLPCYDFTPVADPTVVGCLHCWLAHRLRVKPTPMVCWVVCSWFGFVFSAVCCSVFFCVSVFL